MKKLICLFFAIIGVAVVSAQSKFPKADLGGGVSYFNTYQDTVQKGEGWNYAGNFMYRTALSFMLSGNYCAQWQDTAAGERFKINAGIGKTVSSDESADWIVGNEFFIGYQYYQKLDHYVLKNSASDTTDGRRFQKSATTHSAFLTEDFYVFRDGSDEIVKAFSFHKISFSLLYSFKEKLRSSFAGEPIHSQLDPEDNTTFFYNASYKTKVLGVPLGGTTGLGFYGGAGYGNLSPFGKATGLEVSGSIAIDNYNSIGNPIEISYSHHFIGGGINSVSLKINLASWYYLW